MILSSTSFGREVKVALSYSVDTTIKSADDGSWPQQRESSRGLEETLSPLPGSRIGCCHMNCVLARHMEGSDTHFRISRVVRSYNAMSPSEYLLQTPSREQGHCNVSTPRWGLSKGTM